MLCLLLAACQSTSTEFEQSAAAYPNTGAEILRRGQLRHIPGGTYLELRSSGKLTIADRILKDHPSLPQQDPARDILGIGDLIYIPLVD